MELFEILFIALFILVPILEQVLKRGRKGREAPVPPEPDTGQPGPEPMESPGEMSPRSAEREPVKAEDMVPDDLWAVLTGEQRQREGAAEPSPAEPSPTETLPRWEEAWTPRPEPRWRMDDVEEATPAAPVDHGPEAYSLETFEREPVSLEAPLASPDERHRRFHGVIDRPRPRRSARRSRIGRALRTPESLRQAFVLSEVLGTPKGLE